MLVDVSFDQRRAGAEAMVTALRKLYGLENEA